jgi:uncharacterized surface protein with fasciclin (FAS1) repeats
MNIRKVFATAAGAFLITASVATAQGQRNIVETAAEAGTFTTLVAAIQAAGLVDVLAGEGPFTVFAPTDEAFAMLPEGTVQNLLLPENINTLVSILTYHVIPGAVMSSAIAGQTLQVTTVQGGALTINAANGVMVNEATVTAADIVAGNGVIHVIDKVLLPPAG